MGPDHPDTLGARHNLAISYSDAGRTQDALELRERVLADHQRLLGPDHPATLSARHNLATIRAIAADIQQPATATGPGLRPPSPPPAPSA
ncbi:tetratricopeptide repeat protein [Streptomyces niveus]|uniref:tetratricopeptide repeat protein n=1 Tax=Streptomyces niveus TaxID=193462 RepID=UPI0036880D5A